MKEFSFFSLLAISQDMLGSLFRPAIVAAIVVVLLFVAALWRQHGPGGMKCRAALLLGILGAVIAIAVAPFMTQASFANIHGAVDWVLLGVIGVAAFAAVAIAAYAVIGLTSRPV